MQQGGIGHGHRNTMHCQADQYGSKSQRQWTKFFSVAHIVAAICPIKAIANLNALECMLIYAFKPVASVPDAPVMCAAWAFVRQHKSISKSSLFVVTAVQAIWVVSKIAFR